MPIPIGRLAFLTSQSIRPKKFTRRPVPYHLLSEVRGPKSLVAVEVPQRSMIPPEWLVFERFNGRVCERRSDW